MITPYRPGRQVSAPHPDKQDTETKQEGEQRPDEMSDDPRGVSRPTIYLEDLPWTSQRTIQEQRTEEERKAARLGFRLFDRGVL